MPPAPPAARPRGVELAAAEDLVASRCQPLAGQSIPLELAAGHVVCEPVHSPLDLPSFDRSAMDGFAVRAREAACRALPVGLDIAAGQPAGHLAEDQSASIATGAALPAGADSVVPVEQTTLTDGLVTVNADIVPGQHIRRRGEDVRVGDLLVDQGDTLTIGRVALLAAAGIANVKVHRRPRVTLVVTGSELVSAAAPLPAGGTYDVNGVMLEQLLRATACTLIEHTRVADCRDGLTNTLRNGLTADLLLISGGASVGRHDLPRHLLRELDVDEHFWGVQVKPGKPAWFGSRDDTLVFILPGNPLACLTVYLLLVEPALRALAGERAITGKRRRTAIMAAKVDRDRTRTLMIPATLARADGCLHAHPMSGVQSHMVGAFSRADGLMRVDPGEEALEPGSNATVYGLPEP